MGTGIRFIEFYIFLEPKNLYDENMLYCADSRAFHPTSRDIFCFRHRTYQGADNLLCAKYDFRTWAK